MSFANTSFYYLDKRDSLDFQEHFGTEFQDILVSGRKTIYRLEKYISEKEFYRIKVILTALVRDFNLPPVRYTSAIALTLYAMTLQTDNNVSEEIKDILNIELALLLQHLMLDDYEGNSERELFDRDFAMVSERWNEYLSKPSEFVL